MMVKVEIKKGMRNYVGKKEKIFSVVKSVDINTFLVKKFFICAEHSFILRLYKMVVL
jgi:hypothetical protein